MKNLLFWLLFPFILPQALWVKQTATRFSGAAGKPCGVLGEGPTRSLLAIGDSIIDGVGAATFERALVGQTARALALRQQASIQWTALGTTGITSNGVVHKQLRQLPDARPDFVIVSVGVNDVTALTRRQVFISNLNALMTSVHRYAPEAVIAVAGLPPLGRFPLLPQPLRAVLGLRASVLDQALEHVIESYDYAVHVPISFDLEPENFSADGYHPNEDSYVEFGRIMAEALVSQATAKRK
ncbi:MAG: SGNH/GDSL hydrolase family protein [Pseudomonadota bacterium]